MPEAIPTTQRLPQGLLGFLQTKNGGKNPGHLQDTIQAIIDLWPLLLQAPSAIENVLEQAIVVAANGPQTFGANLVVPTGELWAVSNISFRTDALAAGEAITISGMGWAKIGPSGGLQYYWIDRGETVVAATQIVGIGMQFPGWPLLLIPGARPALMVKAVTVGADVLCNLNYTRLPI